MARRGSNKTPATKQTVKEKKVTGTCVYCGLPGDDMVHIFHVTSTGRKRNAKRHHDCPKN